MKTRSVRSTVLRELPAAPTIGDKRATVRPHGGKGMPRDLDPGVVAAIEIAVGEQHTAKVSKRIERLTELRRAMEAGAFVMEVEREMNLAWKALP